MNILVTGSGRSGSWQIRGEQLGRAIGARVKPQADLADCERADLIIVIKRVSDQTWHNIKLSRTPWLWDVVDFYPQPSCSKWSRGESIKWVRRQIKRRGPNSVIWPNYKMREDCGRPEDGVIRHHFYPNSISNPIRQTVKTVGYDGNPKYLGRWHEIIEKECKKRDWIFVPVGLKPWNMDICVAFRDGEFAGYAQKNWKSCVKLENCHGSGTPFVGQAEPGYLDIATGYELFTENERDLADAFDLLTDLKTRERISGEFKSWGYSLRMAATDLQNYIERVNG